MLLTTLIITKSIAKIVKMIIFGNFKEQNIRHCTAPAIRLLLCSQIAYCLKMYGATKLEVLATEENYLI